jgi:hypothetical protein
MQNRIVLVDEYDQIYDDILPAPGVCTCPSRIEKLKEKSRQGRDASVLRWVTRRRNSLRRHPPVPVPPSVRVPPPSHPPQDGRVPPLARFFFQHEDDPILHHVAPPDT